MQAQNEQKLRQCDIRRPEAPNAPGIRPMSLRLSLCCQNWFGNFPTEVDFSVIETTKEERVLTGFLESGVIPAATSERANSSRCLRIDWTSSDFWSTSKRQKLISKPQARNPEYVCRPASLAIQVGGGRQVSCAMTGELPTWNEILQNRDLNSKVLKQWRF